MKHMDIDRVGYCGTFPNETYGIFHIQHWRNQRLKKAMINVPLFAILVLNEKKDKCAK